MNAQGDSTSVHGARSSTQESRSASPSKIITAAEECTDALGRKGRFTAATQRLSQVYKASFWVR